MIGTTTQIFQEFTYEIQFVVGGMFDPGQDQWYAMLSGDGVCLPPRKYAGSHINDDAHHSPAEGPHQKDLAKPTEAAHPSKPFGQRSPPHCGHHTCEQRVDMTFEAGWGSHAGKTVGACNTSYVKDINIFEGIAYLVVSRPDET